jgi:hypothetical protein
VRASFIIPTMKQAPCDALVVNHDFGRLDWQATRAVRPCQRQKQVSDRKNPNDDRPPRSPSHCLLLLCQGLFNQIMAGSVGIAARA